VGEALLADITPEKQRAALFGVMVTVNFTPYLYLTLALFALADLQMYTLGFIILSLVMPLSIPLIIGIGTGNANRRPDVVATPQS
jgi:hypothetical protein